MKSNKTKNLVVQLAVLIILIVTLENDITEATTLSELKKQEQQADKQTEELRQAKEELSKELGNMNSKLYELSNEIDDLQTRISKSEEEIKKTTKKLEKAKEKSKEQYNDMKLRIRFVYENGEDFSWISLFTEGSITDMLNRAQYMIRINSYDRKMLDEYNNTYKKIKKYNKELNAKNEQLQKEQKKLEQKEKTLLASISDKKSDLKDAQNKLQNKKENLSALSKKIKAMEEYEKKLEEEKARKAALEAKKIKEQQKKEAQRKQQEKKKNNSNNNSSSSDKGNTNKNDTKPSGPVIPEVGEKELLAALIYCEAGGESHEAQLAVGSVVINRVNSSYFPNTITGVIYQNGQFSPAASGKLALVLENNLTTTSCKNAAAAVLAGNVTGDWLYFCFNTGEVDGYVIGKQVFY